MQLGDLKDAGAAFDILTDYFNNDFSHVKQADKRHGKRRQLRAEPLDSSVSTPTLSLSSLGNTSGKGTGGSSTTVGGRISHFDSVHQAGSVLSDLSVTPIHKRQSNDRRSQESSITGISSGKPSPTEQRGRGGGGGRAHGSSNSTPKPDLHVEDYHNVADLVHRLTQRTGLQPGQTRVSKTPDSLVDRAEHMADLQYKELRYSNRMNQILSEVMEVNGRLSAVVHPIAGHRKDLGRAVEEGNKVYLRLFESMMSEILLIHRKKFKSQTKDLTDLRAAKALVDAEVEQLKAANEVLRARVNSAEIEHDTLKAMLRARDKQVAMLSEEIERLDEIKREYLSYLESVRAINARRDAERDVLEARLRAEEQAMLKAQLAELQAQFMRTQSMLQEAQANAKARDMANNMTGAMKKKVPTSDSSSQTRYTDFNVFDKQDGWTLPISGTAASRINWRRALNFSTCPACRGVGRQIMGTAVLLRRLIRGEGEKNSSRRGGGTWNLPDETCQFISNLPRYIMAHRPYALSWTVNRISHLFLTKIRADEEDIAAGYPVQSLEQFIIEKYLMLTETRGEAEMGIHRLLQSVKEHYRRHPLLHTFARFMYLLQDDTTRAASKHEQEQHRKHPGGGGGRRKSNVSGIGMAKEMAAMDAMLKPTMCDLPISVLSLYLFAREELLRPGYRGAYANAIEAAKTNGNGDLLKYQTMIELASTKPPKLVPKYVEKPKEKKVGGRRAGVSHRKSSVSIVPPIIDPTPCPEELPTEESTVEDLCDVVGRADMGKEWGVGVEDHVCVMSNFHMWIPLDRAIEVVNTVLNFLTDSQLLAVTRRIEHISAFLSPQGTLTSADGNHTEIRQHMRAFLPSTTATDISSDADGGVAAKIAAFVEAQKALEPSRQFTVVVNLDDALQTIAEMLLTRIAHMEERLGRIFYEGDTNGDGILSYQEFFDIVNRIAPHFSQRRILSMYREVLMMGEDSEKIELPNFVTICKKYGLIKLVDFKRIYDKQRNVILQTPSSADSTPSQSFEEEGDTGEPQGEPVPIGVHRRIDSIVETSESESEEEEVEEEENNTSTTGIQQMLGHQQAEEVEDED